MLNLMTYMHTLTLLISYDKILTCFLFCNIILVIFFHGFKLTGFFDLNLK